MLRAAGSLHEQCNRLSDGTLAPWIRHIECSEERSWNPSAPYNPLFSRLGDIGCIKGCFFRQLSRTSPSSVEEEELEGLQVCDLGCAKTGPPFLR